MVCRSARPQTAGAHIATRSNTHFQTFDGTEATTSIRPNAREDFARRATAANLVAHGVEPEGEIDASSAHLLHRLLPPQLPPVPRDLLRIGHSDTAMVRQLTQGEANPAGRRDESAGGAHPIKRASAPHATDGCARRIGSQLLLVRECIRVLRAPLRNVCAASAPVRPCYQTAERAVRDLRWRAARALDTTTAICA